jgi:hypothetical protein
MPKPTYRCKTGHTHSGAKPDGSKCPGKSKKSAKGAPARVSQKGDAKKGQWEQPFKRGQFRQVKIVDLDTPVPCANCQSPVKPKRPARRTYDGIPLCTRHARPYEQQSDDRDRSRSIRTVSGGLPTLGKEK